MSANDRITGAERMRTLIGELPAQLAASDRLSGLAGVVPPPVPPARVVLCGMGGSAIAGDLVGPLLSAIQLVVRRDYGLPDWVGPGDLVLASSYSGDTAETLGSWDDAGRRGCSRIAVTSGGELAARAVAAELPVVVLPAGLPPRAALGHGTGALVRVLGRLGCLDGAEVALDEAVDELTRLGEVRLSAGGPEVDGAGNPHPRRVAEDLVRVLPVIHTAGDEAHAAGLRLRAQFNENAKVPALLACYPELDHNEVEAWDPEGSPAGHFGLVCLRAAILPQQMENRLAVTGSLLDGVFAARHTVVGSGAGPLARIMSLVQWGDALSWHLADMRGIDPVPVDRIERLKRALAEGPDA